MTAFRRLAAWRRAHALVLHVHDVTGRSGFADQPALALALRRVAIEIPGRVAQGSAYARGIEFGESLEHALAAARALHSHVVLARDLRALSTSEFARLDARVDEVCRILVGLRRTVAGGESTRARQARERAAASAAAGRTVSARSRPRRTA